MPNSQKSIVQGDIMFKPYQGGSWTEKEFRSGWDRDRLSKLQDLGTVIAEGEKTGHKHSVLGNFAKLIMIEGARTLFVAEETQIVHDEHPPSNLVSRPLDYH